MARNWKRAIGATLRKPQADKSIARVGGARAESNSAPWPKAEVENANQRSIEPSKRNTGVPPIEFMVYPPTLHKRVKFFDRDRTPNSFTGRRYLDRKSTRLN